MAGKKENKKSVHPLSAMAYTTITTERRQTTEKSQERNREFFCGRDKTRVEEGAKRP